jgi:hypothetical protein
MRTHFNAALARFRAPKIVAIFSCALLFSIWGSLAQAAPVTEDTYMYIKWKFVSAGNNCSGHPGKTGELYSFATAPATPPPSYMCCDEAYDPNSCVSVGGSKTGMPSHEACASATPVPPPAQFDMTLYKYPGAGVQNYPDMSSYNGSDTGTQIYMTAGTNLTSMRVLTGFTNNQGASCPGLTSMYCYGGSYKEVAFDTSAAKCDQWVDTTYSWCAWSSAVVSVKFKPVGGCATGSLATPTPTPPPGTPAPTCDTKLGGVGRQCTNDTECGKCGNKCTVAGNQPLLTSNNCTSGTAGCNVSVNYVSGYDGTGSINGTAAPQASGPLKICVPSADAASYSLNMLKTPASVQTNVDTSLVKADTTSNLLRCMLPAGGSHRMASGCKCEFDSEPVIMSTSAYNAMAFHLKRKGSKLDMLWAQVVDLMQASPKIAKRVHASLDGIIPSAGACYEPSGPNAPYYCGQCSAQMASEGCLPSNMYCCKVTCGYTDAAFVCGGVDDPTPTPRPTATPPGATPTPTAVPSGSTPNLMYSDETTGVYKSATSLKYGENNGSLPGANSIPPGQVLACALKCPPDGTHNADNPNYCDCPAGKSFKNDDRSCVTCFEGASIPLGGSTCLCPNGYIDVSTIGGPKKCRPQAPSAEYVQDASSDWYPVCGGQRVPMSRTTWIGSNFSSNGVPKTAKVATIDGIDYPYAQASSGPTPVPQYFYNNYPHCGCGPVIGSSALPATVAEQPSSQFIKDDTNNQIGKRGADNFPNGHYGPVAIAKSGTSDGRLGSLFSSGASACGCPNVNEKLSADGTECVPMVDLADSHIRFVKYDPAVDVANTMSGAFDVKDSSGTKSVAKISIPNTSSSVTADKVYDRGIWKCDLGFLLTGNPGKCVFDKTQHMCDATSEVSKSVGGASTSAQFANARNKKLACCMNGFGGISAASTVLTKFDCIENMKETYSDFNALWASSDDADNGGQMNAFVLADGRGKPITGFYTENGVRCGEFNEFSSTPIQPGRINPIMNSGQMNRVNGAGDAFESVGSAIPNPSGTGFNFMVGKLGSSAKAPTSTADRRRCPILVRAALMVGCPRNPASSNAIEKTYEDPSTKSRRCAVASSVQVKIRVEQVWEIAGQPKLQPVDTVIDNKAAGSISVDRIIQKKFGNQCPKGTRQQGDACVYEN